VQCLYYCSNICRNFKQMSVCVSLKYTQRGNSHRRMTDWFVRWTRRTTPRSPIFRLPNRRHKAKTALQSSINQVKLLPLYLGLYTVSLSPSLSLSAPCHCTLQRSTTVQYSHYSRRTYSAVWWQLYRKLHQRHRTHARSKSACFTLPPCSVETVG